MATGKKRPLAHAAIVPRFAAKLRELRVARGMTQVELARRAQVTASYVTRLEAARAAPGIDLVDRLAVALGCGVVDLLPTTDVPDMVTVLKSQVRRLSDAVLTAADPDTLQLAAQFLARLVGSTR